MTSMKDGVRVRTTRHMELWTADWHFVSTLAGEKRLLDDLEIPEHLHTGGLTGYPQFTRIDKVKAQHLGYVAEIDNYPAIPSGSLGYVRLLDIHTLSHKRDKPGHILGFPSDYWFSEEVVPAGTEAPENFHSVSRWYALELDNWDITGNKHGYVRGLKHVHTPLVNGYTSVIPDSVDHPDYELPDYLEEISNGGIAKT